MGHTNASPRNFSIASTAGRDASETQAESMNTLSIAPGKCRRAAETLVRIGDSLTIPSRLALGSVTDLDLRLAHSGPEMRSFPCED